MFPDGPHPDSAIRIPSYASIRHGVIFSDVIIVDVFPGNFRRAYGSNTRENRHCALDACLSTQFSATSMASSSVTLAAL